MAPIIPCGTCGLEQARTSRFSYRNQFFFFIGILALIDFHSLVIMSYGTLLKKTQCTQIVMKKIKISH